jgi:hypothetical protein
MDTRQDANTHPQKQAPIVRQSVPAAVSQSNVRKKVRFSINLKLFLIGLVILLTSSLVLFQFVVPLR